MCLQPIVKLPLEVVAAVNKDAERIIKQLHNKELKKGQLDADLYQAVAEKLWTQTKKGLNFSNPDYDSPNTNLIYHLEHNIFKFSAAKNTKQIHQMALLMLDDKGKLKPYHKFKEDALELHKKYNDTWLKTEYEAARAQAQMSAKWLEHVADADLYDIQYTTAGDSLVRDSHAKLNGITLPVDHSFWRKYFPKNGWKCRCGTRKVAKGTKLTKDLDLKGLPKPDKGFSFNPGMQKEIFEKNHKHFEKFTPNNLSAVNDYGMRKVEHIYYKTDKLPKRATELDKKGFEQYWERLANVAKTKEKNSFIIKSNRTKHQLLFDNKLFNKIRINKEKEQRWKLALNLQDIINKPNEVWLVESLGKKYKTIMTTYIRYYRDKAIVVITEVVGDEPMRVLSFYEISTLKTGGHLSNLRKGILLHRN